MAPCRYHYGPDSVHAEFDADTCSEILGLPTCGAWLPDNQAFIKLLTHEANPVLGAWCLIGIVAASMSTADGAMLAMGTVWYVVVLEDAKRVKILGFAAYTVHSRFSVETKQQVSQYYTPA